MSALPYPTPTRLRLARAIALGQIRHFHFLEPETRDAATDGVVTARVAELVAAGLAEIPPNTVANWSTVRLTDAGAAWLERGGAGTS